MQRPFNYECVLDAVLRQPWSLFDRAKRKGRLWWQRSHAALVAAILERLYHACLSLEPFSASINQNRLNFRQAGLVKLDKLVDHCVDPSTSLDIVQAADNYHKLFVKILTQLLDVLEVWRYLYPGASFHNCFCGNFCFILAYVPLSIVIK
jgi:hypothetical protein